MVAPGMWQCPRDGPWQGLQRAPRFLPCTQEGDVQTHPMGAAVIPQPSSVQILALVL